MRTYFFERKIAGMTFTIVQACSTSEDANSLLLSEIRQRAPVKINYLHEARIERENYGLWVARAEIEDIDN